MSPLARLRGRFNRPSVSRKGAKKVERRKVVAQTVGEPSISTPIRAGPSGRDYEAGAKGSIDG